MPPPSTEAARSAAPFRALSFNLRADGAERKAESQSWKKRKPLVVSLLQFHRPDLIGFQEAIHRRTLQLAESLPGYGWIGAGRMDGKMDGELNPIFYRKEAFQIVASGTFWLSPTPDRPSFGWGAAHPRIATWARLERRENGAQFLFCNTHFDHRGVRARRLSAELMLKQLDLLGPELPRVVSGDFNCQPGSAPYRLLASALRDASLCSFRLPLGPSKTWRGLLRGVIPPAQLDYLFVSRGIGVRQAAVLADHWDGRFPSDHLPVAADLYFESGREHGKKES